jgi:hypothetical protein
MRCSESKDRLHEGSETEFSYAESVRKPTKIELQMAKERKLRQQRKTGHFGM